MPAAAPSLRCCGGCGKRRVPLPPLLKCVQVGGVSSPPSQRSAGVARYIGPFKPLRAFVTLRVCVCVWGGADFTDSQLVPSAGAGGGDRCLPLPGSELLPTSGRRTGYHAAFTGPLLCASRCPSCFVPVMSPALGDPRR